MMHQGSNFDEEGEYLMSDNATIRNKKIDEKNNKF